MDQIFEKANQKKWNRIRMYEQMVNTYKKSPIRNEGIIKEIETQIQQLERMSDEEFIEQMEDEQWQTRKLNLEREIKPELNFLIINAVNDKPIDC